MNGILLLNYTPVAQSGIYHQDTGVWPEFNPLVIYWSLLPAGHQALPTCSPEDTLNLFKWWNGLKMDKGLSIVVIHYFSTITNLKPPNLYNLKLETTHDLNSSLSFNQTHIPNYVSDNSFLISQRHHTPHRHNWTLSSYPFFLQISFLHYSLGFSQFYHCSLSFLS